MQYRPLNDLIDPDVTPDGETPVEPGQHVAADGYVIGEDGRGVVNLELSEALARRRFRPPKPVIKIVAAVLGLAFVGLTAWNLARILHPAVVVPSPTPFQVKQALYLGVMKVEAFRRVHGSNPDSIEDAGLPTDAGYEYQRVAANRYTLSFQTGQSKVNYDSSVPVEQAFGSARSMLQMGGSQ